ncbi:DMT family transporter [Wenjunlia tyrosinilytica]|uniref:Integral membrane protein n=1 Tax=Wenjunlia tyrosinilytica TaxID=1544741 RepID=A0A918DU49_9ACTN|nr:DMT family transporter [Wenjunlia tyrosinilytica]GGO83366.1 hypothetical protein GCM10012280_12190 [Wenjunlia tyrosinilytica]
MGLGLVCALAAAVFFGAASVFQAVAARRTESGEGVDPRLLMRVLRQWPFLAGIGLDGLGFCAELVALRTLPLYVVGAALASSLAVTAVVAARVLRVRLSGREWAAVATVCGGLALLALASGPEGGKEGTRGLRLAVLGAAVVILGLGFAAGRLPGRARAAVLGLAAGLGFGVVAVSVRLIPDAGLPGVLANPALYALLLGGLAGFLFLTSALHRGSVTTATAGLVIGETVGPALVGVIALGDRTRDGMVPVAVAGFGLAVAGALALARFGEPAAPDESSQDRAQQVHSA